MSLLDDLKEAAPKQGVTCKFCEILKGMNEEERAAAAKLSTHKLAEVLVNNGHAIGNTTIAVHRRKGH